jgi:hypothetical protein
MCELTKFNFIIIGRNSGYFGSEPHFLIVPAEMDQPAAKKQNTVLPPLTPCGSITNAWVNNHDAWRELQSHQSVHNEIRNYPCPRCRYAAKKVNNQRRHMREIHHMSNDEIDEALGHKRGGPLTVARLI